VIEKVDASPDVVIVGAGIGGSALARALADAGLGVVLLEKTLEHRDLVRGEWMAPWGVAEADRLGLTPLYEAAGANRPTRFIVYDELETREESESKGLDMVGGGLRPPICIGHPKACDLLNEAAVEVGATLCRGIRDLVVTAGAPPRVDFRWSGSAYSLRPRWVVGADGRSGIVARQIGCVERRDPEHHRFSGMLVGGVRGWPDDLQVIATEGDVNALAFPQGGGRMRVYLGFPKQDRARVSGPDGPARFLDAWRLECVPRAEAIVNATPVSPCIAYANADAWVDSPVREGVVLIGDAAGRNDPTMGQGLSVTHRDVRLVRDALLGEASWSTGMFDEYVRERAERMARLRVAARLTSLRAAAFGPEGHALRREIHERIVARPELGTPFLAAFLGPEALPAEVFAEPFTTELVGRPIWSDLP